MRWSEQAPNDDTTNTLLIGRYEPSNDSSSQKTAHLADSKRHKIAAFDFVSHYDKANILLLIWGTHQDSTLIETASGKKFPSDANDWKWWHASVPTILRKLYFEDG
jgi:bifunctional polynucleotide phosphatase/kinase